MKKIFITGTDTEVGKTFISSWLCLHFGFEYFKPIQTGPKIDHDAPAVAKLSKCKVHDTLYSYKTPCSPHLAARIEGQKIDMSKISLPSSNKLLVEGAGGVLVPVNDEFLMIDLIRNLQLPVVVVASSKLGTINHTLLTLEALKKREVGILGVIMNGPLNYENVEAIELYGKIRVLAQVPEVSEVSYNSLLSIKPPKVLAEALSEKRASF